MRLIWILAKREFDLPLRWLGKSWHGDASLADSRASNVKDGTSFMIIPKPSSALDMKAVPLAAAMWDALSLQQIVEQIKAAPVQVFVQFSPVTNVSGDLRFSNPRRRHGHPANHRLHREPARREDPLQAGANIGQRRFRFNGRQPACSRRDAVSRLSPSTRRTGLGIQVLYSSQPLGELLICSLDQRNATVDPGFSTYFKVGNVRRH